MKKAAEVGKITLEAYQEEIDGVWHKAIMAIFEPAIRFEKTETMDLIENLCQDLAEKFSEIMEFDNDQ